MATKFHVTEYYSDVLLLFDISRRLVSGFHHLHEAWIQYQSLNTFTTLHLFCKFDFEIDHSSFQVSVWSKKVLWMMFKGVFVFEDLKDFNGTEALLAPNIIGEMLQ